ncbi:hypothetical protein Pelo_19849 [Pelomyxa schiedti]|nr:hypothetical protein Pelo_19849 [Pelomyxa schiedti]
MLQTPFKSTPSDRIPENFTQQCRECVEESISPPNLYNNHVGFSVQFALYNNRHANFKNLLLQLESEQNLTEQEKAEKLHKAVFDASL